MNITIEEDNKVHLERFKNYAPDPSFIAGFLDGDGCVFIRKISDGYQSGIQFTQCRTNILQVIRLHFGGSITSCENRNNKTENIVNEDGLIHKHNIRNQYNLTIRSDEYEVLLNYILHFVIIKSKQIHLLYEFSKIVNLPNKIDNKELLYETCSLANEAHSAINTFDFSKINIAYIAGLLDAEGCFFISSDLRNYRISLCQKCHPVVLYSIQQYLGYGQVSRSKIELIITKKSECILFIAAVKSYLIVKYNQALLFKKFLLEKNLTIKQNIYRSCNKEKHEIEQFTNLNSNNLGTERFQEVFNVQKLKKKVCKEILLKQFYKERSKNMMGEKNRNFGKNFSEETKKKMSNSIRDSKNSVSDEIIQQVREMVSAGNSVQKIIDSLNLPRHTVSRIKNGNVVCRNETKIAKESTAEERNIAKRKIKLDEILYVIDRTIDDKKSPAEILEKIGSKRKRYDEANTVTIDIIKNIRRKLGANELPFYKSEVNENTYNFYFDKLCKFNRI
jgi:hypothetical protein